MGEADNTASDERLVALLAGGDEAALRLLYRRWAGLVFAIAARSLPEASAEEIVQDVFLSLWRKGETFDPAQGSFKAWLAQIVRRRRRKPESAAGPELEQIPDELPAPDEAHWQEFRRRAVRSAVEKLPPSQRQALSLAFLEELSHEQVAAALALPLGTVKTRIRTALKRLAPALLALATLAALAAGLVLRGQQLDLEHRAVQMVTSSDAQVLHLAPTALAPPGAHGNYRARAGCDLAVLTTSALPAPAAKESYQAWARIDGRWLHLGEVRLDAQGKSLLIARATALARAPDLVEVTREGPGSGVAPVGPVVLAWPSG